MSWDSIMPTEDKMVKGLTYGEAFLNHAGVISSFIPIFRTGYIRIAIGIAEVVYAGFCKYKGKEYGSWGWYGVANIVRGFVETLFVVGALLCLVYDFGMNRIKYHGEQELPLMSVGVWLKNNKDKLSPTVVRIIEKVQDWLKIISPDRIELREIAQRPLS